MTDSADKPASKFRTFLPYVLCAACGGILRIAFPDFEQTEIAWFIVAPLLILLRFVSPKKGFWLGFTFGIVCWMSSLCWLLELRNNGGPVLLVALGLVGLSVWCALFTGVFGMLASFVWQGGDWREKSVPRLMGTQSGSAASATTHESVAAKYWFETWRPFVIALLWVGTEYIRSNLFTGFAWNSIGVSQYANIAAIQVASLGGVYAVSFLVILMNGAIAGVCVRMWRNIRGLHPEDAPRPTRRHFDLMLILAVILVALVWSTKRAKEISLAERDAPAVRIAAMNPEMPCIFERLEDDNLAGKYQTLGTNTVVMGMFDPDLVVWPETVLYAAMPYAPMEQDILSLAAQIEAPILAGATEYILSVADGGSTTNAVCMNASFLFGARGRVEGVYRKQHLVPFGEYIPFDKTIPWLQRFAPTGVSVTPGAAPVVMDIANGAAAISPLICFEDTVSDLARHAVQAGAQILVSQSNDAWFTGSSEARQHHAQAIFRAVENGVPMVRSSNHGVTAAVSATGRLLSDNLDGLFFSTHVPVVPNRRPTLYTRIGDWALGIPSAMLVVAGIVALIVATRKRKTNAA